MSNGTTIVCAVSLKSRPTTYTYLQNKASRLGVSVEDLKKFYVCREVITQVNKGKDVYDLVKDREAFDKLTTEKPWLDIVAMNSRGKTNKRKVTADKPDINAVTESVVVQEVKLSDETEAYLKRKEELIGKDNLDRIHKQVWGEDEEAEAELRANPF
jgi:DNA topoisomerase IB